MKTIQATRRNSRYLPGVALPDNMDIQTMLANTLNQSLSFVFAVPSHAFRTSLRLVYHEIETAGRSARNPTIIWGTKGFDYRSGKLLSEVCQEEFGEVRQGVISGPSFASETALGAPTALTMACAGIEDARDLAHWFRTESTRVYYSDDLVGVQLGGAIKNVIAIAAGISDGLGYGANARAALVTRGLSELTRLVITLGGKAETSMGLTGVGDLILTCTDDQSRNRRFGLGIGRRKSVDQVKAEIGQEIEGINTAAALHQISLDKGVEMPITQQIFKIIFEGVDPAQAVKALLHRDPKAESV